ncbi:MAG: hypothetical protein AAF939_00985 [Planctomycetota bacterium]
MAKQRKDLKFVSDAIKNREPNFGFLKVIELTGIGHCGGLLIVAKNGRPIEFHCTAPVVPNRAREIIFGETFLTCLFTEQIGISLIDHCKTEPAILIVQQVEMASITELVDFPVAFIESSDDLQFDGRGLSTFNTDSHQVFGLNSKGELWTEVRNQIDLFSHGLPLDEPFERIQSAIEEANQARGAA